MFLQRKAQPDVESLSLYLFLKLTGTGLMVGTPGSSRGTTPLRIVCPVLTVCLRLLFLLLLFPLLLFRLLLFPLLLVCCPPLLWFRLTELKPVTLTLSPTSRNSSGTWFAGTAKKTVPTETRPSSASVVVSVSTAVEAKELETSEQKLFGKSE